jgi:hypothetical protein
MALMTFSYRGYTHPGGEVTPESFDTVVERNDRGVAVKVRRSMQIRVNICAVGDTNINQRVAEIEAAYGQDGGDAVFYLTTGVASHWRIDSGSSLYGVLVDGPHWTADPRQADWVTGLSCTIGLSAEYAPFGFVNPNAGSAESIEVIGTGGPAYKLDRLDNGPPQITLIHPATEVLVVQSGESFNELTGIAANIYPNYTPPLFPSNIKDPVGDFRVRRSRQREQAGRRVLRSAWSYTFTFTSYPFVPNP